MMNQIPFEFWRSLPIILAALGQTAFVLVYAMPAFGAGRWWVNPVGRTIFTKACALALLLIAISSAYLARYLDDGYSSIIFDLSHSSTNLELFVVAAYYMVCVAVFHQLYILIKQRFCPISRAQARQEHLTTP